MRKNLHHKIMLSILAGSLALGFIYAPPAFAENVTIKHGAEYTAPDGNTGIYDLNAEGTNNGKNYNDTSISLPTGPIDKFTVLAGFGGYTAISHDSTVTGGDGGSISLSEIKNAIINGVSVTAGNGSNSVDTYTASRYGHNGGAGGDVTLTFTNVVNGNITAEAGNGGNTFIHYGLDDYTGGAGGDVELTFNVVNGNITAEAGYGGYIYNYSNNGNLTGGNGGNVTLIFEKTVTGNINATGGNGGNIANSASGMNLTGGNGGDVTLTFKDVVNGNITAAAGNGGNIGANISSADATGGDGGNVTLTFNDIVVTDSISLTSGMNGLLNGTYNCTPGNGGSVNFTAESIKASSSNSQLSIRFNKNYGDITFDVGTLNIADNTVKITANGNIYTGIIDEDTETRKANHIDNLILTGNGDIDTTDANGIKIGQLTIDGGEINDTNWAGFHERAYGNDIFNIKNGGVTFNINNSQNLKHGLTGKGGLTKTGNGTLELAKGTPGINFDYEGITTITQGTIDASATTSTLSKSAGLTLYGGATFVANTTQDWNGKQIAVYDNGSDTSATYQGNLNAQNSNLYFIASGDNTNSLLKVINNGTDNNGNVNIAGSNYNLGLTGDKILDIGSKLTLIEADGTINADNLEPGSGIKVGSTIKQDITTNVEVSVDDSGSKEKLIATVSGALATDEASAINTGMLGGLAFNLQGADLIAREGMEAAIRSAHLDNNHAVFAALTRSSLDYGAVDVDGTNMLAGLAWRSTTGAGSMTYGVFAEHGDGSYDTYANINGTSLHGEGDTDYTGGGILARMDFDGSENGHGYLEASGRVGNADTDYTNSGLRDAYGRAASYSTDGTYYGAHIGAGYVQKLDEKSSIDWYGKLLWARLEGGSADLSTGEHLTFDDADSLRLRIGGRWNYTASDFVNYYAGLGYEYEFDGEANGFTNGLALGDEDLTGGSGVAELGISFKPSKNSPFSLELNLAGFTGEREGFRGGVEAVYMF